MNSWRAISKTGKKPDAAPGTDRALHQDGVQGFSLYNRNTLFKMAGNAARHAQARAHQRFSGGQGLL